MCRWLSGVMLLLCCCLPARADDPPKLEPYPELLKSRKTGWQVAELVFENLEAAKADEFPGIHAWLQDLRKATRGVDLKTPVEKWPAFDVDALVMRNPHYWQAYFEVAPGDPGLAMLHAGLLLAGGEAARAQYVALILWQRPHIPPEVRKALAVLVESADRLINRAGREVQEGIKKFDAGDYDGAATQFRRVIAQWPQYSFAHYELAMTLWHQSEVKAGRKPPPMNAMILPKEGDHRPAEVKAAYARSRQHDSFQWRAYQGYEGHQAQLRAMVNKTMPNWEKVVKNYVQGVKQKVPQLIDDEVLTQLAEGCQGAGIDDLAITARQVLAARRGRYDPADHPFLSASLRKLAPSKVIDATLQKLAGENMTVRQLIAPEPPKP
jgi:hypothetical protein